MSQNISLKILWQISSMEEKLRPPPKFFFFLAYNFWQIHCIVLKRGVGEVIHSIQSKFWVIYCKGSQTTLAKFWTFFLTTYLVDIGGRKSLIFITRWYLHIVDISSTTYLPRLVNVVCERPPSDFSGDVITTKHPTPRYAKYWQINLKS